MQKLNSNKIGMVMHFQVNMLENGRRNIFRNNERRNRKLLLFRGKQKTKNVLHNIFRCVNIIKKVRSMSSRQKDSMKRKCYVFSCYKQRNKACLLYIECEVQQHKYGKHVQVNTLENCRKNTFKDKETLNKVPLVILDVNTFTET